MNGNAPGEIPVVILCGGYGTRIREASESLPKPMIDIGGKPILWHIMKRYSSFGFRRFVLCLGYKGELVREYILRYDAYASDFTRTLGNSKIIYHDSGDEDWEVTCSDTGLDTLTGGRLARVARYLEGADRFMLTYGDGLADIALDELLASHLEHGLVGTVTAVHPTSRFGELGVDGAVVTDFAEKPMLTRGLVNGGFFVFERAFLDYVEPDAGMLESHAFQKLATERQLGHHVHTGFWRGMDTYREYVELNRLWNDDEAPWRCW